MTQVLCVVGQYVTQVPWCSLKDSLHTAQKSSEFVFVLVLVLVFVFVLVLVFVLEFVFVLLSFLLSTSLNCLHLNKSSY